MTWPRTAWLVGLLLGASAPAAVTTWDPQGTTSAQPGSGSWESSVWSTQTNETGLSPTVHWVEGTAAVFAVGSSTSTPAFTVTMNAAHTVAGVFDGSLTPGPCAVTITGAGTIILPASTLQGFDVGTNASATINVPITGSSSLVPEGAGQLYLNAVNTYSGQTLLGYHNVPFTGSLYFNNNSSFGSGTIWMTNGSGASLIAEGSPAFNIPNAFQGTNLTLNIIGNAAGATFSGPWNMTGTPVNTGAFNLGIGGSVNNIVALAGLISGTNGFTKSGGATLVLSGSNTYGTVNTTLGSTAVSSGTLFLANTSGSATGVSGITVSSGATLSGSGFATGTVNNSGSLSATNLAGGTATLTTGGQTWGNNTVYQWAVNNVSGAAGAASGWDELVLNGGLTNSANSAYPLVVNIISLTAANQQGALASFNNAQDYSWIVLHSTNPAVPISGFSAGTVTLSSASFANAPGSGVFSLTTNNTASGGDLFVNFVHTPVLSVPAVTVNANSNAVLAAGNTVPNSIAATATYAWRSNNVPMTNGGRISGSATPNLTIAAAQVSDEATYSVSASNPAGSNLAATTLTVIAASTSVSWAAPSPIIYGTPLSSNQLDATANVPGNFVYTPAAGANLPTGTYNLSAVFTPSNNLYSGATTNVSITVLPAPLTVTASNSARPYNTANPSFGGTIVGLQNGDNITASYSTTAVLNSPAGMYPIMPALVDPGDLETNYSVTLVNGILDVGSIISWTPGPLTYGTPLGSNQLDATADIPGNFVYSPNAGTVLNSGTHTLSTTFTPVQNSYNTTNTNVSLVVSPEPLAVTAANATRQAGIPNPAFTGTIVGLTNGDSIGATYSSSAISSSPAGTYSIVPTLVDSNNEAGNYSVSLIPGLLTVTAPAAPITAATPSIIPLPVTLSNLGGVFTLCPSQTGPPAPARALMSILVDGASQQTGQFLAAALYKSTGYQFAVMTNTSTNAVRNAILITTSNAIASLGTEGYELSMAPDSVVIRAPGQSGTFYGVQSLLQLLPPQIYSPNVVTNVPWVAPCVYIKDYPQFVWRGAMLDVARHFFNKQEVKQLLDAMAIHKLNTFHWHLVDDQGWRLQITNYPNLTATGAWRSNIDFRLAQRGSTATNVAGQYGGFYTQADAKEVVAYAAERHITIVPEIEMPCHSTAGLASYPQFGCNNPVSDYNMDNISICGSCYDVDLYSLGAPGTMAFLEDVLSETMAIFPGKYIHCGGDEVVSSGDTQWNTNTADLTNMAAIGIVPSGTNSITQYQHWLSTNLATFLQAHGRTMIGWTETENGGIITNAALMDWEQTSSNVAMSVAEAGMPVVVTLNATCYVNNYEVYNINTEPVAPTPAIPVSTVYGFNPIFAGLPAQYTNNILGAQCSLWCEDVPSFKNVLFKMFPRETALSEITWTPLASQNYASFTNRLVMQKTRLDQMGANYDHEAIPQVATWGPSVSTSPTTFYWDITTNVAAAGEIDVSFVYNSGNDGLAISSVALLQNGVQVDIDVHAGFAGAGPTYTLYVLHLPETKPGATYTLEAIATASGGTNSSGTVYLPNWN